MNSESISSEPCFNRAGERLPTNAAPVVSSVAPPSHQSMVSAVDHDGEEVAFAKAPTLMMDQEPDNGDSQAFNTPFDPPPKYYIQGVVQNRQVHIVTNLPGGESQVLFQRQMVWTIGRNRDAALPLRDRVLSRRHAVILYVQEVGFHLIDLNSMNGSYVNGVRLQQRHLLTDGDLIRLGSVEFSFFTSLSSRMLDPIHPEVLARFTNSIPKAGDFIGFSALEEPEIFFRTSSRG